MLGKSDEAILDERLRNWGRWAEDRKGCGASWLWSAMKRYGKPDPKEKSCQEDDRQPKVVIDSADAVLVNRAWQGLPNEPLKYERAKWVLVAQYCYPYVPVWVACRNLKINAQMYDELLGIAKYMMFNRLNQQASKMLASESE